MNNWYDDIDENDDKSERLEEERDQIKEELFLAQSDLTQLRTENTSLKNFLHTVYESCEGLEDTDLALSDVLKNLKENIRVFAKDHHIFL